MEREVQVNFKVSKLELRLIHAASKFMEMNMSQFIRTIIIRAVREIAEREGLLDGHG